MRGSGRSYVIAVTALAGFAMAATGIWQLGWPHSFTRFVAFPDGGHFQHDAGAFSLGLGLTLLLACVWSDALATALTGFLVANTAHTAIHIADLPIGGRLWQVWVLGGGSVALAAALALRIRQLGGVLGTVTGVATPPLAPYVRCRTALLDAAPVDIAVEGDHAYLYPRQHRDPMPRVADIAPRGTGPAIRARTRRLDGAEAGHAARVLAAKYPLRHGVLLPLAHRLARRRSGRAVHFEVQPDAE
jgi:hypothetical protein